METNITPIVEAIFGLVVALITTYLIPYLKKKYTSEQLKQAMDIIEIAVAAAEQIKEKLDPTIDKKLYVQKYLFDKGIKLDEATIDNMIEASVLKLHQEIEA